MADQCEIVEALGASTSSAATETAVISTSIAQVYETLIFVQEQSLTSVAAGTSTATPEAYAVMDSFGAATSTLSASITVDTLLASQSDASSTMIVLFAATVTGEANGTSYIEGDAPSTLVSSAAAVSTVTIDTASTTILRSVANTADSVVMGLLEVSLATAAGTATATPTRQAYATATDAGAATSSTPVTSTLVRFEELLSQLQATSVATLQVERTIYHRSLVTATSSVFNRDKYAQAMVLNTETAAVSTYDNFAFNSVAYVDGKLYAATDDGLYLLEGANDNGEDIRASLKSGFNDLGEPHTKHAGSLYFGYTSDAPFTATVETYGAGHGPQTYELESREADAPRNNRIKLGKGLSSRYWRVTIENKDGSHFELNDASIDVAVSQRRV